ncbi:MAG: hypothetical protein ACJARX_001651 [Psychroserpens sp.]|jgi:hypothetical protein|uniref:hypothetical protein n=1 Tax=Psychroserpens sp. TaxID=2020870 RepID=UPI0039E65E93
MRARLEDDAINVYNEQKLLIGSIKTTSNFKNTEIKIGEKIFQLSRNKWETKIVEDDQVIYHLKMNSFSRNITILETHQKITGVFGFKFGTKLIDKESNTLVKVRNENQFVNKNTYEIEIANDKTTNLDILTTIYGHLYGSNNKQLKSVILGAVIATIIIRNLYL